MNRPNHHAARQLLKESEHEMSFPGQGVSTLQVMAKFYGPLRDALDGALDREEVLKKKLSALEEKKPQVEPAPLPKKK
jgi:hypothetical protein